MSLLYKDEKDIKTFVKIENYNSFVKLQFSKDCGKFGTSEIVDSYYLTPGMLLEILQERRFEKIIENNVTLGNIMTENEKTMAEIIALQKVRIKQLEEAGMRLFDMVHEGNLIELQIKANELYETIKPD